MDHPGVQFVFSPALYPQTPLSNHTAFAHGNVLETKQRNGELVIRVKDEKGEWEAYGEGNATDFQIGETVRAYGLIVPQPDGKMMLAAKWIKKTNPDEHAYCIRHAQKEWNTIIEKNPSISTLKPFELPKPKPGQIQTPLKETKSPPKDDEDFVSAHQLNVEKEYL